MGLNHLSRISSAERINAYVAILAELAVSLDIGQATLIDERRLPVVDSKNLDIGIVGQTMDFPNMTERVSGR